MAELHRLWLHALEDDPRIRSHPLQVARVLADFAANRKDGRVHVSWRRLQKCTHQGNGTLARSLAALHAAGWLETLPRKRGERAWRILRLSGNPLPSGEQSVDNAALPSREHSAPAKGALAHPPREHERQRRRHNARARETEFHPIAPPVSLLCGRCGSAKHGTDRCPN